MYSLAEFTCRDGIAEADRARYNQLTASFEADLRPVGAFETSIATEILRASWRIQRYAAVNEAELPDDATKAELNRARAAAVKSLRWGITELRKLQTNREIQQRLGIRLPGIVDVRQVLKLTGTGGCAAPPAAPPTPQTAKRTQSQQIGHIESMLHTQFAGEEAAILNATIASAAEFTERTQITPRNAPCTCGSGEKYKRCCGKDAPAVPGNWLKLMRDAA